MKSRIISLKEELNLLKDINYLKFKRDRISQKIKELKKILRKLEE